MHVYAIVLGYKHVNVERAKIQEKATYGFNCRYLQELIWKAFYTSQMVGWEDCLQNDL